MTGEEGTKIGSISNPRSTCSDGVVLVHGEKANSSNGQSLRSSSSTSSEILRDSTTDLSKSGGSSISKVKDKNCNNIPDRESDSSGVECEGGGGVGPQAKNGGRGVLENSNSDPTKKQSDSSDYRFLGADEVSTLSRDKFVETYNDLVRYAETLKKDNAQLKESEEKFRAQQVESSRRENVLVMRLTTKEHEMQDYIAQLNELKQAIAPTPASLRNTLIDPAVNLMIQRMKKELDETKKKLEDTQNDLNAWKFTPDSNTGKRLMAKCRMLYQENEDLGKMITSGKLAKLESDLELDELIQELDEDVEGMQGTIYYLQQELRTAKTGSTNSTANNSNASTSNSAVQQSLTNNDDFQNEVVSLTVKITDLCAQCQVTHQKKQSPKLLALKMEIDDDSSRTNVDNGGMCMNGENSNSSSHSDPERLKLTSTASPISSNSDKNDRTTRTSVANAKLVDNSELNDPKSNIIRSSDSESRGGGGDENRTKGKGDVDDDDDSDSDRDVLPPTKRTKLSESPIGTKNVDVGSILSSANQQNGSMEH
ncbi:Pre-mRNA-splicing regulator WTAP [Folsomia candida]|uniref:Pre-mRNA-splicing regulator WTAP n=1 Tax=Folsomia candida TaxID=158441 RepID=A0A226DYT6_FOLCA|nr:Pre-mRNA-splicing regulator WTAP [Folsomia candida]